MAIDTSFDAFTAEWLDLQTWAALVRRLPDTTAGYQQRYGVFQDTGDPEETQQALISLREIAEQFGGATEVKTRIASDGRYLTGSSPPAMVYGEVIWWALQVENACTTVGAGLNALMSTIGLSADDVRGLLTGAGGLAASARTAQKQTTALKDRLTSLQAKATSLISTFAGSNMVNEANRTIGDLTIQIDELIARAAQDYEQWKHESLSPGEPPPPLQVAKDAESGFAWPWQKKGEKAAKADYAKALELLTATEADVKAKAQFVADVKGLDVASTNVILAFGKLSDGITAVGKVLEQAAERVESVSQNANDKQLTDPTWLSKVIDLESVEALGTAAQQFAQRSLVSPSVVETPGGDPS